MDAEAPPSVVADLAEACVRFVKDAIGIDLDYSADTLPVLDHYVRARAGEATDAIVDLLAPAAGAYFGEVARRGMPGVRWHVAGDAYPAYRLEFEAFYLCFNPIGVAVEVITRADAGDWNAHFAVLDDARQTVETALARNPVVEEDDYYTFSVRHEVLQQVAALLGALETRARERRSFGPDVYRAAQGEGRARGRS
jgi:hypothetical protein